MDLSLDVFKRDQCALKLKNLLLNAGCDQYQAAVVVLFTLHPLATEEPDMCGEDRVWRVPVSAACAGRWLKANWKPLHNYGCDRACISRAIDQWVERGVCARIKGRRGALYLNNNHLEQWYQAAISRKEAFVAFQFNATKSDVVQHCATSCDPSSIERKKENSSLSLSESEDDTLTRDIERLPVLPPRCFDLNSSETEMTGSLVAWFEEHGLANSWTPRQLLAGVLMSRKRIGRGIRRELKPLNIPDAYFRKVLREPREPDWSASLLQADNLLADHSAPAPVPAIEQPVHSKMTPDERRAAAAKLEGWKPRPRPC